MQLNGMESESQIQVRMHARLLGHGGYGVTELRTFRPRPMAAYADSEDDIVRLGLNLDGQVPGIYIGVQPRPLDLFDRAPNYWRPAISSPETNCACDRDIEFITACFFDIDVLSETRTMGHPATEVELQQSLETAMLISQEDGIALSSTVCCSGNGHYVLAPVVPIPVDSDEVAAKFRYFCHRLAEEIACQVKVVRIDPVYNLSRVM